MNNIIGVDLGTTHCKIIVVNRDNKVVFSAKKNCRSFTGDDGMHEQDAEEICSLVTGLLKQAFANTPANQVTCVCFSAAMHSLLAVDAMGKPTMNALTWADTRAAKYAAQIRQSANAEEIYKNTGTPIHAMSPLCKLVWLKNERPQVFSTAAKFISVKEYIFHKLVGKYVVDHSIASATGLFNIHTRQWNNASLQLAGITTGQLSQPYQVTHAESDMLPQMMEQIGINAKVDFVLGCSDGAAAQLGSGTLLPNEACVTIGTSGAVRTFAKQAVMHQQQKTFVYAFLPGMYLVGGATNNGGNVVQWFPKIFAQPAGSDDGLTAIVKMAGQSVPGAKSLLFVPYLHGERSPVWNAEATAQLTGLKSMHTVNDVARAVIEGVLLNIWAMFNTLPGKEGKDTIYANGGFFANNFMAQMLADISNKKVLLQEDADSSAMGAVYTGMLACGWLKDVLDVKQFTLTDTVFLPREKEHAVYEEVFKKFIEEAGVGEL